MDIRQVIKEEIQFIKLDELYDQLSAELADVVTEYVKTTEENEISAKRFKIKSSKTDFDFKLEVIVDKEIKNNLREVYADGDTSKSVDTNDEIPEIRILLSINSGANDKEVNFKVHDILRHEIEHLAQWEGKVKEVPPSEDHIEHLRKNNFEYFLSKHEIPAMVKGMKKVSDLSGVSLKELFIDYLTPYMNKKLITEEQYKTIIDVWTMYANQKGFIMENNKISGGKGDKLDSKNVNIYELMVGIAVEKEHTDDEKIAKEIALDHLAEDPKYYTKLMQSDLVDEPEAIQLYKKYLGQSIKEYTIRKIIGEEIRQIMAEAEFMRDINKLSADQYKYLVFQLKDLLPPLKKLNMERSKAVLFKLDDLLKRKVISKDNYNKIISYIKNPKKELELTEAGSTHRIIDGVSKQSAKNKIYKITKKFTTGIYRDNDWRNVSKVWKELNKYDIDVSIVDAYYDPTGHRNDPPGPMWKKWMIEIPFIDNKGKEKKIEGYLMASAAGSVEDPMDAYDLNLILY